ncbi:TVP38/TMEM64 family protein [Facklamia sp. P13064]|uniref:TVP38/TMEM64 family protein n=2 Tax=unclassified Facklamia TaxID=2622293 RepID=UPI003D177ADC
MNAMQKKQLSKWFKVCLVIALVALTIWLTLNFSTERVREIILQSGSSAKWIYVLLWVFLPMGFFPVPFLAFAGGMGFGLWLGSILTFIGAALNLTFMFLISRYLFRQPAQKFLFKRYPSSKGILTTDNQHLKLVLALARIMPVIPYNVENYAFGLTDISFWDYLWISLICILPGTFIFVNVGDKALEPSDASFSLSIILVALLVFGTAFLGKFIKKKNPEVAQKLEVDEEE